jgi:hypothetical protein
MKWNCLAAAAAVLFLLAAHSLCDEPAGPSEIRGLLSMSSEPFATPPGTVSIGLPGGDFETGGEIPSGWQIGGGKLVADDAPQGKTCCYFNARGGGLHSPTGIAAQPGGPYFLSWRLKSPVDTTATINFTSEEREPSFHSNPTPVPATGNQWRHVGYYFLMPIPCKTIQFHLMGSAKEGLAGQLIGVDDVQLRTASEAEMATAYEAQRKQLPPRDVTPRPDDGQNLALSVAKWEGRAGIPGKPFVIWAIGSSWTRGQGDGYGLIHAIRQRFPHAPPIIYKRQVEPGMPWDFDYAWVKQFVAAQQPDLIFTYTLGTPEGLDALLPEIRRHTTADIIVPSIHFVQASTLTPDDMENGVAPWDEVREVCRKHGAEFVDNRREQFEYLQRTGVKPTDLLGDPVHQNYLGRMLVWDNVSRHITKPDHFAYAPESRERRITVAPPTHTATEQVTLSGDWTTAEGAVRTAKSDARLKVRFTGNRIDLLGRRASGGGTAKIFIDGKPADQAPVFSCNFIQPKPRGEKASAASPHAVELGRNVVPQTWTITVTSNTGDYRVEGSVTGPDGEGNLDGPFWSKSGQIGIDPKLWRNGKFDTKNHKVAYGNHTGEAFTFDIDRCARGEVSFRAEKPGTFSEGLVQNLPNCEHTLELVATGDGEVTLDGLYVFQPPEKD